MGRGAWPRTSLHARRGTWPTPRGSSCARTRRICALTTSARVGLFGLRRSPETPRVCSPGVDHPQNTKSDGEISSTAVIDDAFSFRACGRFARDHLFPVDRPWRGAGAARRPGCSHVLLQGEGYPSLSRNAPVLLSSTRRTRSLTPRSPQLPSSTTRSRSVPAAVDQARARSPLPGGSSVARRGGSTATRLPPRSPPKRWSVHPFRSGGPWREPSSRCRRWSSTSEAGAASSSQSPGSSAGTMISA